MLESEIEQLEEYYRDQQMPRKILLAVSIRRQTLANGPGPDNVEKKKKKRVGRYDTHPIHTTLHTLLTHYTPHTMS